MKSAIICFNCNKLKKTSETYMVKVAVVEHDLQTGKRTNGEVKSRICRPCAKRMGYKVKVAKKQPLKEVTHE